jgi:anaerobic magnesium-protoporphyrin IX monomethyl ester cyclase
MRFKKVLLICPPSSSRYGGLRFPAGIGYIAQALHDESIYYEFIDMRNGLPSRDLESKVMAMEPDLIGISMITLEYKRTYRMISGLKRMRPGAKIVVGGHHVTILKEKVLEECKEIDFGVVSDGEKTIVELCRSEKGFPEMEGLIFRAGERVIFTGERPPVKNLDVYAFPKYIGFRWADYSKQIPVNSSRGCLYECTFCPNKLIGRRFRMRTVNHFVNELEYWHEKGYRQFAIDDDNFTLNKKRVYEICDEIERRGLKDLLIRCSNGIRADRIDRNLLIRMKEIGVREIGIGVDGGNNKVLGYLKKGETIEQIEAAIQMACELGLDVKIFIIVGTPGETVQDIEDSIALARRYPIARVNFNNAIPYPGTEMYETIRTRNLFLVSPEEYLNDVSEDKKVPVFETPELSLRERVEILKKCDAVEKEVMKNTAIRMYSRYPMAGFLIKNFFNVGLFERLFFKNLMLRKLIESMRYRWLLRGERTGPVTPR